MTRLDSDQLGNDFWLGTSVTLFQPWSTLGMNTDMFISPFFALRAKYSQHNQQFCLLPMLQKAMLASLTCSIYWGISASHMYCNVKEQGASLSKTLPSSTAMMHPQSSFVFLNWFGSPGHQPVVWVFMLPPSDHIQSPSVTRSLNPIQSQESKTWELINPAWSRSL